MRPIQLADIEMAARVLIRVAPSARAAAIKTMIAQVEQANCHRHAHGLPHPQFGCGTLMSRAGRMDAAARPAHLGPDALDAYAVVIAALMAHQSHQIS
jgi:hypothetical protein